MKNKYSLQESENSNVRSYKMKRNISQFNNSGNSSYQTLSTNTEKSTTCYSNAQSDTIINNLITKNNADSKFPRNVSVSVFGTKVTVKWTAPFLFYDSDLKENGIDPDNKKWVKECIVDKIKPTYYTIRIYDDKFYLTNSVNSDYYTSEIYLNTLIGYNYVYGYYYTDPIFSEKEITFNFSENPYNIKIVYQTPTIPSKSISTEKFVSFYVRGYELVFKIKQYKNDMDINAPNINFIKISGEYNRNYNRLEESAIEFSSNLLTEIKKLIKSTDQISNSVYKIELQYDKSGSNNSFIFKNNKSSTSMSSPDKLNIDSTSGSFDSWAYYDKDTKYASDIYSDKNFRYIFIESFQIPEQKYLETI